MSNRQQRRASAKKRKFTGSPSDGWTEEMVQDILDDPFVVGIGGFPKIIDDDTWIRVQTRRIEEEGPEVFLRSLLKGLRKYDDGSIPPWLERTA